MSEPVVIVEVEFSTGTWTAVSTYLRFAQVKRGKQRTLNKINAGTLILSLANEDRRFDPEYSAGPYFGNLLPGKGIRLKATWNAVTYPVFTGFIDRIVQTQPSLHKANVVLECSDGLSKLANTPLGTAWATRSRQRSPFSWFRFNESVGPTAFDNSGNGHHGTYFGSPAFEEPPLFPQFSSGITPETDTSIEFPVGANYMVAPGIVPLVAPYTISFIVKIPARPAAGQYILYDTRVPKGLAIAVSSTTGVMTASVTKEDLSIGSTVSSTFDVCDNTERIFHIVAAPGALMKLYSGSLDFSWAAAGTAHTTVASSTVIGNPAHQPMAIDELQFFNSAFDLATVQARVFDYVSWAGDTIAARVGKILDSAIWTAGRSITTDADTFLAAAVLETSALAHLQAIESTMEGRIWVTKDGTFKLLSRLEHAASPYTISQATFGEGASELHYEMAGNPTLDFDRLANVIRRKNGNAVIEAVNLASITAHGFRESGDISEVESLYVIPDFEYTLALYRLAHFAEPLIHMNSLRINPRLDPSFMFPIVLMLELADRVTFKHHPQHLGSGITIEAILEGITHEIGPKHWIASFDIDRAYAI